MPSNVVCDCPYTFGGGECISNDFANISSEVCINCPIYKHWYHFSAF